MRTRETSLDLAKQGQFPSPSIISCLSDAVHFRKVLLWVLEGTETQGPLQICLVCKIFSKKAESSDQQETRRTRYWHPQRNVFVGASIRWNILKQCMLIIERITTRVVIDVRDILWCYSCFTNEKCLICRNSALEDSPIKNENIEAFARQLK